MAILQTLYGGTFNPIHYGHLKPIRFLANLIGLKQVTIIPNNIPPHRPQPEVSSIHRKAMLELAISDMPLFRIDEYELRKNSPSYTFQTLKEYRNKYGLEQPIAFIIGQDSLLDFFFWHEYKSILDNSHLIVCRRPGYSLLMKEKRHQKWIERYITQNIDNLYRQPSGKIYMAETPLFNISSSSIRKRFQYGQSCEDLMPRSVLNYISQHGFYKKKEINVIIKLFIVILTLAILCKVIITLHKYEFSCLNYKSLLHKKLSLLRELINI